MKKILNCICQYDKAAIALLKQHGYEVIQNQYPRTMAWEEIEKVLAEVDGIIAGSGELFDEKLFRLAGKLKIIARYGVGYDNVDVPKATQYGIMVTNTKVFEVTNGVAEFTIGLILDILRRISPMHQFVKEGQWIRFCGRQFHGMTVGILGFGAIGKAVAKMLAGFTVNILAYDKYPDVKAAQELHVTIAPFEQVLKNSEVVTLHIPSLKDTYHIMGVEQFKLMKDQAYFINTARGKLVDTEALYETLRSGKLAGAALDVYENEPPGKDYPLFGLDNVICTPHVSSETVENTYAISMASTRAVIDALEGRVPDNLLNPEIITGE
jgi:D-3-phosphoglycerate dehydrogenase